MMLRGLCAAAVVLVAGRTQSCASRLLVSSLLLMVVLVFVQATAAAAAASEQLMDCLPEFSVDEQYCLRKRAFCLDPAVNIKLSWSRGCAAASGGTTSQASLGACYCEGDCAHECEHACSSDPHCGTFFSFCTWLCFSLHVSSHTFISDNYSMEYTARPMLAPCTQRRPGRNVASEMPSAAAAEGGAIRYFPYCRRIEAQVASCVRWVRWLMYHPTITRAYSQSKPSRRLGMLLWDEVRCYFQ